jgi:hypothetical protein
MAMLEANDDGGLNLPAELIGAVKPHTKFEFEILGDTFVLRPADKDRPFWERASRKEWLDEFHKRAEAIGRPTPDISLESMRRENMYD